MAMQNNKKYWWNRMLLLTSFICNLAFAHGPIYPRDAQKDRNNTLWGTVIGYAAGFYPIFGTGTVLYSTHVSPQFSHYDDHKQSEKYQSAAFTHGLLRGHLAGVISDLALLAVLYKYHGRDGLFWGAAVPLLILSALSFPGKPS